MREVILSLDQLTAVELPDFIDLVALQKPSFDPIRGYNLGMHSLPISEQLLRQGIDFSGIQDDVLGE